MGLRLLLMRMTNFFCCDSADALTESFLYQFSKMLQGNFSKFAKNALRSLFLAIAGVVNDSGVNVAVDMMIGTNALFQDYVNIFQDANIVTITIHTDTAHVSNSPSKRLRPKWKMVTLECNTFCKAFYPLQGTCDHEIAELIGLEILRDLGSIQTSRGTTWGRSPWMGSSPQVALPMIRKDCPGRLHADVGKLLVICGESVHDFNTVSQLVNAVVHELEIQKGSGPLRLLAGQSSLHKRSKSFRMNTESLKSPMLRSRAMSAPDLSQTHMVASKPWVHFGINSLSYIVGKPFQGSLFSVGDSENAFGGRKKGLKRSDSGESSRSSISLDDFPDDDEIGNFDAKGTGITWLSKKSGPVGEMFHDAHLKAIKQLLHGGFNVISDEFWINKDWVQNFYETFENVNYTIIKVKRTKNHVTARSPFLKQMKAVFPTPEQVDLIITESETANPMVCAKRILAQLYTKQKLIQSRTRPTNSIVIPKQSDDVQNEMVQKQIGLQHVHETEQNEGIVSA